MVTITLCTRQQKRHWSAWAVTWSGTAELHDSCCSSPGQLPAELRDSCLLICLTIASWAACFLPAHLFDNCQLSRVIPACSALVYCVLRHFIIAWYPHDQRMISHMISAIQSRDHCMIATWSVHAHSRDQYLISHVISACTVTWTGNQIHASETPLHCEEHLKSVI